MLDFFLAGREEGAEPLLKTRIERKKTFIWIKKVIFEYRALCMCVSALSSRDLSYPWKQPWRMSRLPGGLSAWGHWRHQNPQFSQRPQAPSMTLKKTCHRNWRDGVGWRHCGPASPVPLAAPPLTREVTPIHHMLTQQECGSADDHFFSYNKSGHRNCLFLES